MSAQPQRATSPSLRLFPPAEIQLAEETWTVQRVFDELRWPELAPKPSSGDGLRFMALWREFEKTAPSSGMECRRLAQPSAVAEARKTPPQVGTSEVSSRMLRAYQEWLTEKYPPPQGASTVNKAVRSIVLLLKLAASEGIEVNNYRAPKNLPTGGRPRYYFDDASVERLWVSAETLTWPPQAQTGVAPSVFWRALFILLRTYGPRIQDFAAYTKGKVGLRWQDIHFEVESPNLESLESWPLGWLYYLADKTRGSSGRKYYLPMTPIVRGAIDRLRAGAMAVHDGPVPPEARVFPIAYSNTLSKSFTRLQAAAGVTTRDGQPYLLEDFRKTVATYSAAVDPGLPHALCGWGGGGVQQKHYQQPEVLLVRKLLDVAMPDCFSQWVDPEHVTSVP